MAAAPTRPWLSPEVRKALLLTVATVALVFLGPEYSVTYKPATPAPDTSAPPAAPVNPPSEVSPAGN